MEFIYTIQPTRLAMLTGGPSDEEAKVVEAHVAYLESLAESGTVLLAGRTQTADEDTFGIVIIQAETDQGAQDVMQNDPAVSSGVMTGRVYPYKIAVLSPRLSSP